MNDSTDPRLKQTVGTEEQQKKTLSTRFDAKSTSLHKYMNKERN